MDAKPTRNQTFHLILADIAMAMAVATVTGEALVQEAAYVPGRPRDLWLDRAVAGPLRQRVLALASAGLAALQSLEAEALIEQARRYGVPLSDDLAAEICTHFVDRRNRVLTYRH